MRLAFARASLVAGSLALLLLLALDRSAAAPVQSRLALLAWLGICAGLLFWRSAWLEPLMALAVAAGAVELFWLAWQTPLGRVPVQLDYLVFILATATVFLGVRAGDLVCAALLAGIAALLWFQPWMRTEFIPYRYLQNIALILVFLNYVLHRFWQSMQDALARLGSTAQQLRQHAAEAARIADLAFAGVQDLTRRLGGAVRGGRAEEARLAAQDLTELLRGQRERLPTMPEPPQHAGLQEGLETLKGDLSQRVLLINTLLYSVVGVRNYFSGPVSPVLISGMAAISAAGYAAGRWGLLSRSQALAASLILLQVNYFFVEYQYLSLNPEYFNLAFAAQALIVFLAALLHSGRLAGAIIAIRIAALAWLALAGKPIDPLQAWISLGLGGLTAWTLRTLPVRLLLLLDEQARHLATALRTQRRLVATLFHDLASPLQAAHMSLELGEALEACAPLVQRMEEQLAVAESLEKGTLSLQALDLDRIVREAIEGLGQLPREKDVSFEVDCAALKAMGQSTLLRDHVLANLLVNAVKFSPRGGRIRVLAQPEGAWVRLSVNDQGAGMPQAVLQALDGGSRLPSLPGTSGELGSGYGLALARDYAQGMGGHLLAGVGQDGGALVALQLRAV